MNILLNSFSNFSISSLNEKVLQALTTRQRIISLIAVAAFATIALGYTIYRTINKIKAQKVDAPNNILERVTPEEQKKVLDSVYSFSLELNGQLSKENKQESNWFSPVSLLPVIGMILNGMSNDEEKKKLIRSLHLEGMEEAQIHLNIRALLEKLKLPEGSGAELLCANAIAVLNNAVNPQFIKEMEDAYQAQVLTSNSKEEILQKTNDFAKRMTKDQIPEILKPEHVSDLTIAVLLNATYFKAKWASAFEANITLPGEFNDIQGQKHQVDMMTHRGLETFYEEKDFLMLERKYETKDGSNLAFLIFLPSETSPLGEKQFTQEIIQQSRKSAHQEEVVLKLPKMTLNVNYEKMDASLVQLGFNLEKAHLPRISGNAELSALVHKAKVEVDEEGTTASAVTAAVVDREACIREPRTIEINRPFMCMIVKDDIPLFMGNVKGADALILSPFEGQAYRCRE